MSPCGVPPACHHESTSNVHQHPDSPKVNSERTELLYIEPDTEANPESAGALDDPTFLSLDVRPGAAGPVRFLHSALGLTHKDIYFFANIDGYWYPSDRERVLADLSKGIFLIPTDVNGTYALHWFDSSDEAEAAGGTRVTLNMRGGGD